MENLEVKVRYTIFTAPSCKIQVSETQSQFVYNPKDSMESSAPLPLVGWLHRECSVVPTGYRWKGTYVINHKSPEACECRMGSHGQFVSMVGA
jgi:hypothetical protein